MARRVMYHFEREIGLFPLTAHVPLPQMLTKAKKLNSR